MLSRRALLSASAAFALAAVPRGVTAGVAQPPYAQDFELRDIRLPPAQGSLSRRFTLCVPKHLLPHERVPLLVLLHGLNETAEERMGAYAWVERYGLGAAYDRLRHPPIARVGANPSLLPDDRLAALNSDLAKRPFRGLVIACPFMPDLKLGTSELDRYASFLVDDVIPRANAEAPTLADPRYTDIDGCSLGGHFGLEAFLRRPEAFGAWGGVQTAIGEGAAPGYAARLASTLARVGPRPLHIETTTADAFRRGNEALSRELTKRGVAHDFTMLPGPHDQAFLRESGTLEMLLWHDRRERPQKRIAR